MTAGADDARLASVAVRALSETAQYRMPTAHPTNATSETRFTRIRSGSSRPDNTVAIAIRIVKAVQTQKTMRPIAAAGRLKRYNNNALRRVSRRF